MANSIYDAYSRFEAGVYARIRAASFGEDFGQNSWTTAEEYRGWANWLALDANAHVLEVASGSGGPAVFLADLTGARVTGVDLHAAGVAAGAQRAAARGLGDRVVFREADAGAALPYPAESFDAIVCVDALNHLADRPGVFADWRRLLRPGGRAVFTDPVVITGPVTNQELAERSSIGHFVFTPPGVNERLLEAAGLRLEAREDGSANAATIAQRRHDARAAERRELVEIEGEEGFDKLQRFLTTVHRLTSERRLSRFVYLATRPAEG